MKKLSAREKKLVGIALAAVGFFLLLQFGVSPLAGYYDRIRTETPAMRQDILTARRLAKRFAALDGEIRKIHESLDQRKKEFNPYNTLNDLARREGLSSNLDRITMESKQLDEQYQEETAKVTLKRVPLNRLVGFLYDIETTSDLMTVKLLSIRADPDDSLLLDATFDASTITKGQKREGAAEKKAPAKKARPRRR